MEKNSYWRPVGDQIPAGDGDREEFLPRNGKWGRDGGRGSERRRRLCFPSPTRPVAILLGYSEVSDSAMTMRSRKAFWLAAVKSPFTAWQSRVGKPSTWPYWWLRFGHDDANSERLLHGCSEVSDFIKTMQSRKVFYSAVATSPIRPWQSQVIRTSTRSQRRLELNREEAKS